jgi:hypothetical protein
MPGQAPKECPKGFRATAALGSETLCSTRPRASSSKAGLARFPFVSSATMRKLDGRAELLFEPPASSRRPTSTTGD